MFQDQKYRFPEGAKLTLANVRMPFFTLQEGSPWVAGELGYFFQRQLLRSGLGTTDEGGTRNMYLSAALSGSLPTPLLGRLNDFKASESSSLVCILCDVA